MADQTAASLPEVEHARELLESLYNHSGQIPFNSDVAGVDAISFISS